MWVVACVPECSFGSAHFRCICIPRAELCGETRTTFAALILGDGVTTMFSTLRHGVDFSEEVSAARCGCGCCVLRE